MLITLSTLLLTLSNLLLPLQNQTHTKKRYYENARDTSTDKK